MEPFVLGAVPIKSELIREVQEVCETDAYAVVVSQWGALVQALRRAQEFVIVGYGFSDDDAYGRFLFREAMSMNPSREGALVRFYAKGSASEIEQMGKKLKMVFGVRNDPRYEGEVKPPR